MSKPRYGWWGYVKWMIRQYPARKGRYIQAAALREQSAVQKAIDQTEAMDNGTERLQVIVPLFLKESPTLV